MKKTIDKILQQIEPNLLRVRRALLDHPEIGYSEFETQKILRREFLKLCIKTKDIQTTGLVAKLKGNEDGRTLALKANMDGIYGGHLCGHDVQMTWLLGIAQTYIQLKETQGFSDNLVFIFQPNEERTEDQRIAAREIVESGEIDFTKIDAIMELHPYALLPVGKALVTKGMANAGTGRYRITIQGPGVNAAFKNDNLNPNLIAAILNQEIAKYNSPRGCEVYTVPSFTCSKGDPVTHTVTEKITLFGTTVNKAENILSYQEEVQYLAQFFNEHLPRILQNSGVDVVVELDEQSSMANWYKDRQIKNLDNAYVDIKYIRGTPPNNNDPTLADLALKTCDEVGLVSEQSRIPAGSDAGFYTLLTKTPSFFGFIGSSSNRRLGQPNTNHHCSDFRVEEEAISLGLSYMAKLVDNFFNI